MYSTSTPLRLRPSSGLTISGGSATSGGGILNDGTLTVINSTLTGNAATTGDGGAISNPGTLTVINSTLSGNSAGGSGGGIFTSNVLNLLSSTVTNNRADSDNNSTGTGGGVHRSAGTATLHNSIVAGNFNEDGASDGNDDIAGNLDGASSSNLIGDAATSGTLTNGTNGNIVGNGGTGTINIATVIDTTLASNGGTTQTHRLIPTSPAVEAGNNAALPADTFDLDGDQTRPKRSRSISAVWVSHATLTRRISTPHKLWISAL